MRTLRMAGAVALMMVALLASEGIAAMKGSTGRTRSTSVRRAAAIIDNSTHMDANNIDMFVTNHGSFGWDLGTGNPGLIFPKGGTKTALFAAGIWVGAEVGGKIRTAVAEYSQEYAPGPMKDGTYQADAPTFHNYKIKRGDDAVTNPDFAEWPAGDGAPLDSLGNPFLLGDQTIWSVYNDANGRLHTNSSAGKTAPLGVEVQQTTFAFQRGGALGNTLFLRFRIINKGGNDLDNAFVSVWADPDVGGFTDDLVGCDTTLSLGYCYNATANDALYGTTPPAIGFDFFRGPIIRDAFGVPIDTLGMTSFNKYINGTDPTSAVQGYNLMKGLDRDGNPVHEFDDPLQPVTTFRVSGDPVAGTGWLDSNESDRRMQLSTGPFHMAPNDTQEVVCALIVGQGPDYLKSVTDLKQKDQAAQLVFDLNFDIPSPPPNPTVYVHELDKGIRLIWGSEPVETHSANASLGQDFYFEGFRVWQLAANNAQERPTVLATIDLADTVGPIYSDLFNVTKGGFERTLVVSGKDEGLSFGLTINNDAIRGGRLVNNKEYYFAVTAYAFDVLNTAPYVVGVNTLGTVSEVLESAIVVRRATPRGSSAVLTIHADQISGDKVGHRVEVEQLVQNAIADSLYRVTFAPDESWTLSNLTAGDTVLTGQTNVAGAFDYPLVNGFMPRVISATKPAAVWQHLASGDSLSLADFGLDSAGVYYLDNKIGLTGLEWFNFADGTNHDYQIRILPDTTEFCWEYNFGDPSAQATFRCPFEIRDLGVCSYQDPSDDGKVTAMIRDDDASGSWTWGDRLYIRDFAYASVPWGTPGLLSTDVDPADDDQTLGRIGFMPYDTSYTNNNPLPPQGRIVFRGGRLCTQDVFEFRTVPVGAGAGSIVGRDVKKILAVPNPYYAHSQYELTQFDRVMKFTNIPASRKVTIRIFNLAGDLVRTITRIPSTADAMARAEIVWNLNTENNLPVASGVYIYRVDVQGAGSKTDRLAVFVERERLDNY